MLVFKVVGMSCGHCVKTITESIREQDAQAQVAIDLTSGTVQVETHLSARIITHAIEEAGYGVEPHT